MAQMDEQQGQMGQPDILRSYQTISESKKREESQSSLNASLQ